VKKMGVWIESKYKPEYCQIAFEVLRSGKSKAHVCCKIGISRPTLYDWVSAHQEFSDAVSRGMQHSQAYWEDIGEQGVTGELERFSATPWIFTMKNRFRDDYAEDKAENKSISDSIVEKLIDRLVE
jgi:hypothetical protein